MIKLPLAMVLEVTAKCNYRCPFCYCIWHEQTTSLPEDLPTEKWFQILNKCAENNVREITFSGGEALLRQDLPLLISYAKKIMPEAALAVFTNCAKMNEEFFFFCKEKRVVISTSLQGLRSYGKMTGTRRSYRKILQWLAFAAENEWKFGVSMTATQVNKTEFADMFAAAVLSGASSIQMGAMMPEGRGRKHLELALTWDEWNFLKETIRALPDSGIPYSFSDEMICECRPQPPELLKRFANPVRQPCPAGEKFGVISPDGTYRKCLHSIETFPLL